MKIKDIVIMCRFLALPLIAAGQSNTPTAECKVVNCLNAARPKEKPTVCDVASSGLINFDILVKGGPHDMKNPMADMINPSPVPAGGIYYLIKVIRQKDGAEVPVRCYDSGGSTTDGTFSVSVAMEISESDAVRHAKAEAFWKRAKDRAKNEQLESLKQKGGTDEKMIALFQENLQENQLGMFKVVCTYVSTMPGTWNGKIQAPPVTINVVDTGSNLDKVEQKEQEAK